MSGKIEGIVVSISDAGNLITDITAERLRRVPTDERVLICCDGHVTNGIFSLDHEEPETTYLARIGSQSTLELEIVGINASRMLGIRVGCPVVVQWC